MTRYFTTSRKISGGTAGLIIAALMLLTGLAGIATPAFANGSPSVCDSNSAYCLNDWNNGGGSNPIKMYAVNGTNEEFGQQFINPCNSTPPDEVTPTCPFTVGSGLNTMWLGQPIYQDVYGNSGLCLGANTSTGYAQLAQCGNSDGGGAGYGVFQIEPTSNSCSYGDYPDINRYWSDVAGATRYLDAGLSNGGAIWLNNPYDGLCLLFTQ